MRFLNLIGSELMILMENEPLSFEYPIFPIFGHPIIYKAQTFFWPRGVYIYLMGFDCSLPSKFVAEGINYCILIF